MKNLKLICLALSLFDRCLAPPKSLSCCVQQPFFINIFMHIDDHLSVIQYEIQSLCTPLYFTELNSSFVCRGREKTGKKVINLGKKSNKFGLKKLAVRANH